ncbi:MAG: phenylalanine--tRNA ligase subunit alpha, partial [Rivularia sp. (in: cyanobacteria)]
MTSDLQSQLEELRIEAEKAISSADSLESLDKLRVDYLGKKGQLGVLLRGMGKLSAEERPKVGAIANVVKEALQNNLDKQRVTLETAKIQAQIESETIDVTMPGVFRPQGRIHPLNSVIDRTLDIFVGMGYTVAAGPEMESDYYHFEALNTPPDHPARDMQDTFYLPDGNLLRTQTSSVQIRFMEESEPPIRIIAPGRVYRRDNVDATHAAVFHQMELLAVDEGLTFTDLKGTIKEFLEAMFGEIEDIRFRAS